MFSDDVNPYVFTFDGTPSSNYGIYATEDDTFSPPKRQSRKKIDFRHGTYDFESGMYDNRIITVKCFWHEMKTRHDIREITLWLSRKGRLVFDTEPDKHYVASLYDSSDLSAYYNRHLYNRGAQAGTFRLPFLCEPFARSEQTMLPIATGLNDIEYKGTAATPTLMIFRNNTNQPIRNIRVTAVSLV